MPHPGNGALNGTLHLLPGSTPAAVAGDQACTVLSSTTTTDVDNTHPSNGVDWKRNQPSRGLPYPRTSSAR